MIGVVVCEQHTHARARARLYLHFFCQSFLLSCYLYWWPRTFLSLRNRQDIHTLFFHFLSVGDSKLLSQWSVPCPVVMLAVCREKVKQKNTPTERKWTPSWVSYLQQYPHDDEKPRIETRNLGAFYSLLSSSSAACKGFLHSLTVMSSDAEAKRKGSPGL